MLRRSRGSGAGAAKEEEAARSRLANLLPGSGPFSAEALLAAFWVVAMAVGLSSLALADGYPFYCRPLGPPRRGRPTSGRPTGLGR
jgi:hypothetical protein